MGSPCRVGSRCRGFLGLATPVEVVDWGGGSKNNVCRDCYLERLDRGHPILAALVVEAREGSLEDGARVAQVDVLLHSNVAPVRHLHQAFQVGDRQERGVVLLVHFQRRLKNNKTKTNCIVNDKKALQDITLATSFL